MTKVIQKLSDKLLVLFVPRTTVHAGCPRICEQVPICGEGNNCGYRTCCMISVGGRQCGWDC